MMSRLRQNPKGRSLQAPCQLRRFRRKSEHLRKCTFQLRTAGTSCTRGPVHPCSRSSILKTDRQTDRQRKGIRNSKLVACTTTTEQLSLTREPGMGWLPWLTWQTRCAHLQRCAITQRIAPCASCRQRYCFVAHLAVVRGVKVDWESTSIAFIAEIGEAIRVCEGTPPTVCRYPRTPGEVIISQN